MITSRIYTMNFGSLGGGRGIRTPVARFAGVCLTPRPYHQLLKSEEMLVNGKAHGQSIETSFDTPLGALILLRELERITK